MPHSTPFDDIFAWRESRFVVSGSDDEMIQIHHVSVAAATGGGGASCAGGTPRLRCLHYARGSGIVRIECLHDTPLMLAEVTLTLVLSPYYDFGAKCF